MRGVFLQSMAKRPPQRLFGRDRVWIRIRLRRETSIQRCIHLLEAAPTALVIRSYGMRWRIETFFEDSKQYLGFGDCEMQLEEGASRHWYLLMAAYSFLCLYPDSSVLGAVRSKASSLRANLEHSLKETVFNLLSWVRDDDKRDVDDLMQEIDHLFVHSTAEANVQS